MQSQQRHWTRILGGVLMCFMLAASLLPPRAAHAAPGDTAQVIANAVAYLASQQNDDGGLRWTTTESDPGVTARGVAALAAVGYPVDSLISGAGKTMMDYLRLNGHAFAAKGGFKPAQAGMLLVALAAAGDNPANFGVDGWDVIAEMNAAFNPVDGTYGTPDILTQFWAVLGLSATGYAIPTAATDWILAQQLPTGGWGWGTSDLDLTASMVVVLLGSGNVPPSHPAVQTALEMMAQNQLKTGGWKNAFDSPDDPANPDTTGWVIQALAAAGFSPVSQSWAVEKGDPISALVALQDAEGALVGNAKNAYATIEGLYGLAEQPLYALGSRARALRALSFLHTSQAADGGWGDMGASSDAALAFLAAGYSPAALIPLSGGPSALDYLKTNAAEYATSGPDTAGKLLLVAAEAGENINDFNGTDLVATVNGFYAQNAFGDAGNTWHQTLAIIGLAAAGEEIPAGVVDTLKSLQNPDGGWGYSTDFPNSYPDNTGMALMALAAAGVPPTDTAITTARAFLAGLQESQGGWGDASSTAFAVQGLLAVGEDLVSASWVKNGHGPRQALASYQKSSGPFVYNWTNPSDDPYSTRQAIPALLGSPFPLPLKPYHQAGLVVDFGDETYDTRCIQFNEDSITGMDLITRSGIVFEQSEGFVTLLGEVGCPASDKVCKAPLFWSYLQWDPALPGWISSTVGLLQSVVRDSEIEAYKWVDWNVTPPPMPGVTPSIKKICLGSFTDLPQYPGGEKPVLSMTPSAVAELTLTPALAVTATAQLAATAAEENKVALPVVVADNGKSAPGWYSYAAFGLLVVGLGAAYFFLRNRKK